HLILPIQTTGYPHLMPPLVHSGPVFRKSPDTVNASPTGLIAGSRPGRSQAIASAWILETWSPSKTLLNKQRPSCLEMMRQSQCVRPRLWRAFSAMVGPLTQMEDGYSSIHSHRVLSVSPWTILMLL